MSYQIYLVKNQINGKCYIGQTSRGHKKRFREHIWEATRPNGRNRLLYKAIQKHGKDNFVCELIDESADSGEALDLLEVSYIKRFNTVTPNGYNIAAGGDVPDSKCMQGNSGSKSKFGYFGVRPKGNGFRARVTKDGKGFNSANYWTAEDAAKAYDYLALKIYGPDARLNFPELREQYLADSIKIEPKSGQHFRDRAIPHTEGNYSQYRGVTYVNGRWIVQFYPGDKQKKIYVGCISNEIEAAKIYDKIALEHLGDKAKLNFPVS